MHYFKNGRGLFIICVVLNVLLINCLSAQTKNWENMIAGGKEFTSIAEEEDFIWTGTDIGLVKVNKNNTSVEIFDKTSGLPNNYITAVAIDKNSIKWIGVSGLNGYSGYGLVKYDDKNFTNYNTSNSDIPSNNISALYADKKGNIWIGCSRLTDYAYLVKYDGINWIVYNSNNSTLPSNKEITSITEDSTNLWVGTKGGLVKFDGTNWSIFKTSNSELPSVIINSIVVDKDNNKWFALSNGIAKYSDTNWTVIANDSTTPLYSNEAYSISIDNNDDFWFGTHKGLVKYDQKNWIIYNTDNSDLPANQVNIIMIDMDNNKWLGCFDWHGGGRLTKFNDQNWTIFKTWKGELTSNYINFIREDNNGKIWIGTDENLNCMYGDNWDSFTWNDTLSYNNYYGYNSFVVDNQDNLWLSIYAGRPIGKPPISGLLKYDGVNWTEFRPHNSGLPVCDISSMDYSKIEDALWIATSEGLIKYDGSDWTSFDTLQYIIPKKYLSTVKIDGNIKWVGSNYGLIKFDNQNWQLYNTDNSVLPDNRIEDIDIDSDKNLWIATLDGLVKYDGSNWTVYNKSNSGLEHNWIRTVTIDENNILWIGTSGGLAIYDGTNWKIYNKETSPLLGNVINSIEKDSKDNIWLACDAEGISIFNSEGIVDVVEDYRDDLLPMGFSLFQNYPNPFNPTTVISYQLPATGLVTLKVFNILGQEIITLVNGEKAAGAHYSQFEIKNSTTSSGIYFANFSFKPLSGLNNIYSKTIKMLFLK